MFDPGPAVRVQGLLLAILNIIFYLFPEYVLSFLLTVNTDGVHWHMARCFCSVSIGISILALLLSKSTDPFANSLPLTYNILAAAFIVAGTWHAKVYHVEYFNPKALVIIMTFYAVSLTLNFFLLLMSGWPIGGTEFEPQGKIMNRFCLFDGFVSLFVGYLWMGYPELLLRRQINFILTPHHAYVCRIFGCALAASCCYGPASVYVKNANDRIIAMSCRFLITLLVLGSQLHSQYAYEKWWTHGHWIGMSFWGAWVVIVPVLIIVATRRKNKVKAG